MKLITQRWLTIPFLRKCILSFIGTVVVWNIHAQDQQPMIRFQNTVAPINEALKEIEIQSGYRLSVNHTNFDVTRKVNLPPTEIGLEEALKHVLYGTTRTYMLRGAHILIIPQFGVPAIVPSVKEETPTVVEPGLEAEQRMLERIALIKPGNDITIKQTRRRSGVSGARYSSHNELAYKINSAVNPGRELPFIGIKANLLYGGIALAPNLGVEIGVADRSTIDIRGSYNQWGLEGSWEDNKKLAHWTVSAGYRYWFCERFSGHFVSAHGFFGYYNISQKNLPLLFGKNADQFRFEGNVFGAGVSYGYQWILGKHWNLEAEIGGGFGLMKYDKFDCPRCGDPIEKDKKRTYFGPTRAGITLIYLIK